MAIPAVPSMQHLELPLKTSPKPKEADSAAEAAEKLAIQEVEDKIFEEIKELGLETPIKDIKDMLKETLSQMKSDEISDHETLSESILY